MKFLKSALVGAAVAMAMSCSARPTGHFTLWQLPSVADDHGNSYVIRTSNDSIIVIDGGKTPEAEYLRGFLAALGNKVSAWFFTHPHNDHVFAARKILSNRQGLRVGHIYHSRFTDEMVEKGERHWQAKAWNATVDSITDIPVTDMHAGDTLMIDGVLIRILSEKNPEIYDNQYNNSSMAFRVEDDSKSVVFLGDLGVEGGNKLLNSPYRKYLDCDYLQVAHHGQNGCTEEFYKSIKFTACLWPTATWVWNNDIGGGFNTGPLTTITTRRWMDEIGIKKHYVSIDGLQRID